MDVQKFEGKNGMEAWTIKHESGSTATIYAHGATVTSVKTAEGKELLFVSEKAKFDGATPIRGGIPVVFPIFGDGWGGIQGLPGHGFARRSTWTLGQEGGAVFLTLTSDDLSPEVRAAFPPKFALKYSIDLTKDGFSTTLTVQNTGDAAFSFQSLLHTYYAIEEINAIKVSGLGGLKYIDKLDAANGDKTGDPVFPIAAETDQIFKDVQGSVVASGVVGGKADAQIEVAIETSADSKDCVVWNPWIAKAARMGDFGDDEWRNMLCIEPGRVAAPYELAAGGEFFIRQVVTARL